ncbi:hypothetical protein LP316_14230 [Thalassotalea sp. LPB0316]|uniref:hypothetical protein n=1 Tax=Thalassotalea sp. LPB0316 TaxID=2769490 RepID=UPI00186734BF|nr:hypothetical protein [Thalassotalea sp. LPB0316]QOL25437.1 hypothetical protein LP316_14230 [Thalassotalea sp. LPB0316]
MKAVIKPLVISLSLLASTQINAEEQLTFGLGLGNLYSGLGVNVGYQGENSLKYMSAGCMSYSSMYGTTCGVGAGIVKTDIFDFQTPNHGLGAYLGIVGTQVVRFDRKAIYGGGIGYHYFFNGIDKSGLQLGIAGVIGKEDSGTGGAMVVQLGYQF